MDPWLDPTPKWPDFVIVTALAIRILGHNTSPVFPSVISKWKIGLVDVRSLSDPDKDQH